MLGVIAVAALGIFGAWWLSVRPRLTPVEHAFENQPAGPVFEPAEFLVGPRPGLGECPEQPTQVFAVNVTDGSIAWQQAMPGPSSEFFGEWYVLEDDDGPAVVAQIDRVVNEIPPSIRAIDIATGDLAWQHFLEMTEVYRAAQSDIELVVAGNSTNGLGDEVSRALDAGGQLVDAPPVQFDRDQPFDPSVQLGAGYRLTSNVADVIVDRRVARQVYLGGNDGARVDIRTVADGATVEGDRVPFGGGFNIVGSSSSLGEPVQANGELILTVIGSPDGPNTRLAVFDGSDATFMWSIEDTRAGAVAGDDILYDERNDEPVDAVSTRNLHLATGDNPDVVKWSVALSVNEEGGNGFLGMAGDDLVFAVTSERSDIEFLVVGDESDVPDRLEAAEGYGSGPGPRHHVDEEIFLAGSEDGFQVQLANGELIGHETEQPVNWVRRVDDRVLVVAAEQQFCG